MTESFFHRDGDWLVGNDAARGPWSEDACHAGPVTAVLAAASEALIGDKQLVRLTANFVRPVPIVGFRLETQIARAGRTSAIVQVVLLDRDSRQCASTECLFLTTTPNDLPTTTIRGPSFEESVPGRFPVTKTLHDKKFIGQFIEIRYPPGEDSAPGQTTLWMRTPPIVDGERTSAFQSLCPLADCGNGISRNVEIDVASCVNADLTVSVFRLPKSDWIASQATSFWQADGIGMSHAMLFDTEGAIGTALQSLVVRENG